MARMKDMATRIVSAETAFTNTVMVATGCDELTAEKVMRLYLKNKLAKLDATIGRITVKHGAYLEDDVLANAVAMVA